MKQTIFRGAATALVTPMNENGVDYDALGRLIDFQIQGGISALVITGTTGESATLTDREHREVIAFAVEKTAHRVPLIAGTGSNDTSYAIELSRFACEAGADALLLVTPYYNKTTQKGLIAHYTAVADRVTKPMILYNVPSRTGCNIKPETLAILADHPRIAAIKEASGDLSQVASMAYLAGDRVDIYSGNDDQILPVLSLGGAGVISVLSNLLPGETDAICRHFFNGDVDTARALQLKYLPLVHDLFSEVNPIPAKAALSAMGYGEDYLRLPLISMSEDNRARLLADMKKEGLLN